MAEPERAEGPAPAPGDMTQPAFSPRELDILVRLCRGETYGAIARALGISPHTVDTHIRRLRSKAGVATRSQLVVLAVEQGFFKSAPGEPGR